MTAAQLVNRGSQVWSLAGDVSLQSVPALLEAGAALWAAGRACLIDLGDVRRIDSSGVAVIIEWAREARARHVDLRYFNVSRRILAIAELCGVESLFPIDAAPRQLASA